MWKEWNLTLTSFHLQKSTLKVKHMKFLENSLGEYRHKFGVGKKFSIPMQKTLSKKEKLINCTALKLQPSFNASQLRVWKAKHRAGKYICNTFHWYVNHTKINKPLLQIGKKTENHKRGFPNVRQSQEKSFNFIIHPRYAIYKSIKDLDICIRMEKKEACQTTIVKCWLRGGQWREMLSHSGGRQLAQTLCWW